MTERTGPVSIRRYLLLLLAGISLLVWSGHPPAADEQADGQLQNEVVPGEWRQQLAAVRSQGRRCGDQTYAAAEPLQWDERLALAASRHSRDMATHGRLSHTGSAGETLAERLDDAGYSPRAWGENVASGQPDAESVLADWLASPGHCANLMSPDFTRFGVAVARGDGGRPYWTLVLAAPRR